MSAVFLGLMIYFTIDIMTKTTPPWMKKKKQADSLLLLQSSADSVVYFADTVYGEYRVPAGQVLSQIAELFRFPVDSIKLVNGLTSDHIREGQKLKVRIRALHQIKAGEVAGKVAALYGISEQALLKANNIQNPPRQFREGRVILIPRP
ncbi:MAG: LysM peptidoglycan-binding domain-containing protein [Cytophagales bacterium]|nr:LysM peptidoglycan-binding domain-containing protein [Cytophagales bacterium]